jgi:hypothetical protein
MEDAENARREAFQESERCGKAKKDAIEAMRRVKLYLSFWAPHAFNEIGFITYKTNFFIL